MFTFSLQVCFILHSSGLGYNAHVHKSQQMSPTFRRIKPTFKLSVRLPSLVSVLDLQHSSSEELQHSVVLHAKPPS